MNGRNDSDNTNKMMAMMTKIMPTCQEVSHLTSTSMDEKLTVRQKLGVRFHLLFCKWCRLFNKQMLQLRTIIKTKSLAIETETDNPDHKLSSEFKSRLKKSLEKDN